MSDYDIENDSDYYDDEDMIDGTQDEFTDEDDMDTEGLGGSFLVETKHKHKNYEIPYSSLSQSQVEKSMQEDVDHICGILGVDPDIANLLLRHMKWNKERLIEKYMDNGTSVMVAAGATIEEPSTQAAPIRSNSSFSQQQMPARRSSRTASKLLGLVGGGGNKSFTSSASKSPTSPNSTTRYTRSASPPKDGPFTCPICCDDTPSLRPISLDCSHQFCSNCWTDYLRSKIMDESEISIRCMAEGCGLVTPDSFIHTILVPSDPAVDAELSPEEKKDKSKLWARFQELVIRHFVGCNNSLKYCPYPSCTNTVSCPSAASKSSRTTIVPIVSCGARGIGGADGEKQDQAGTSSGLGLAGKEHQFCFGCTIESDHRPVVCAVARLWLKKCADDSETANWIKSNTKECPTCQSTIEKNGGCNHMTCKKCKGEFCWVCMGPWSEHGTAWYSCNRYDEKAGVEARDSQSRSRASLERYLHYYNRWANHEQSAKLSIDLYSKTEKKMEEMQITSSLTWIEVQFMKKAVEEAEKCRMTLKWTYAMAYYLAKGNQKDLFEDNQRDLEKAVEDLSELLESPIEPENIPSLRQKVTDKTVYVQKRNEIVLEDTATGFMEGRWKWNATVEGFDEPEKDAVAY